MERRQFLQFLTAACVVSANRSIHGSVPRAAGGAADAGSAKPEASGRGFRCLPMGQVKPRGWIREQMLGDLQHGFAGCLDELCPEAGSDIFCAHRNGATAQNLGNSAASNWWNGETEGNWRAGHIMMAYLSEDRDAMAKADRYVDRILSFQDADGYLGIFAPELRYLHDGEFWTQTCLLRGLLAYAELTGKTAVLDAALKAVDRTVQAYAPGGHALPVSLSHDIMLIDLLEWAFAITGKAKYRDFALRYYRVWSTHQSWSDTSLPSLLNAEKAFVGHGPSTYESVRVPLWLASVTGSRDLHTAGGNALKKIDRYTEISGSGVSEEFIKGLSPDPWYTEYEYCATKELQVTFTSALQKTGAAAYGDRVETIWFNAAQGARLADGSAITYLTSDNRLKCDETEPMGSAVEKRNKFSPTHRDVAVCCNPNATQVSSHFVRAMWMAHGDRGLVATLYGPCALSTRIEGSAVQIEEQTNYPFDSTVVFTIHLERPQMFPLYFRNPGWSQDTIVASRGARIRREGDYWRVEKSWHSGDTVRIQFSPAIETIRAVNGEIAVKYGALVFAEPVASEETVIRQYPLSGFADSIYRPAAPASAAAGQYPLEDFHLQPGTAQNLNPLRPFDAPQLEIHAATRSAAGADPLDVRLVPLGNAPILRRMTFPGKIG